MLFGEKNNKDKQVRDLCVDIGRTLLICSLVEKRLHDLLRPDDVRKWLDYRRSGTMNEAINKLKRRYKLDEGFVDVLHVFRRDRNRFVHDIWDIGKPTLNTKEGREDLQAFINGLYLVGSQLNKILWPAVAKRNGVFDDT